MAASSRETPWWQDHVLTNESNVALGLVPAESVESSVTVAISHDCDLAQLPEAEPLVEVIVSQRIEKPDGNCTHAKNSRRLHLPCTASGSSDDLCTVHAIETMEHGLPEFAWRLSCGAHAGVNLLSRAQRPQ